MALRSIFSQPSETENNSFIACERSLFSVVACLHPKSYFLVGEKSDDRKYVSFRKLAFADTFSRYLKKGAMYLYKIFYLAASNRFGYLKRFLIRKTKSRLFSLGISQQESVAIFVFLRFCLKYFHKNQN